MSEPVATLRGSSNLPQFIDLGDRRVAVEHRPGRNPGLFWLPGFGSDMAGTKAAAVDAFGAAHGLAVTRFDYSGHGLSGGDFSFGTISRWLEDTEAAFATTSGPQIVIGSSMGGWLALLLARAARRRGTSRTAGLLLIAPATDMTELILSQFTKKQRRDLEAQGFVDTGSPYRINRTLIEDGRQHLLFGRPIDIGVPIAILQGARDREVPKEHALKLVEHLLTDPVTLTLIPDGDHRLSRPEDLALLERSIETLIEG
ncbi:MAG: alpha/beta hydrolase [Devosia sp.]